MKSFSGAKIQDPQHYFYTTLARRKTRFAAIHIRRNNVTYNMDMCATVVAENIIQIVKNGSILLFNTY